MQQTAISNVEYIKIHRRINDKSIFRINNYRNNLIKYVIAILNAKNRCIKSKYASQVLDIQSFFICCVSNDNQICLIRDKIYLICNDDTIMFEKVFIDSFPVKHVFCNRQMSYCSLPIIVDMTIMLLKISNNV